MTKTNQIQSLIDHDFCAAIDLATLQNDDLRTILDSAESLADYASTYSTSPARIARIAQAIMTDYTPFAENFEFCEMHRCDYRICDDDELTH